MSVACGTYYSVWGGAIIPDATILVIIIDIDIEGKPSRDKTDVSGVLKSAVCQQNNL